MVRKAPKKKLPKSTGNSSSSQGKLIRVDPARIRFQHSRIRPQFSGCGRGVMETLESIRNKKMLPSDLPAIQVIVGPEQPDGGPWYFSLNNRRLWVLKRCREEGLLENNEIPVRARGPKSYAERERYTLENCALEATIMRESGSAPKGALEAKIMREAVKGKQGDEQKTEGGVDDDDGYKISAADQETTGEQEKDAELELPMSMQEEDGDDDSSDSEGGNGYSNPFSALS